MTPIATYIERLIQVRRTFSLYQDHVMVHASWLFKGRFKSKIPLATLRPVRHELRIRNKFFKPSAVVLAMGVVIVAFQLYPQLPTTLTPMLILGGLLTVVGGLLAALTYRPIRFVRFEADPKAPGLDLAMAGPDKSRFNEFLDLIEKQIRRQRAA